jgi:hypothetical protein
VKDQHSQHNERSRRFTVRSGTHKRRPRRSALIGSAPRRGKRVLQPRERRLLAFTAHYAARLFDCPVSAVLEVINSGLVPVVVVRGRFKRTAAADRIGEQFDYIIGDFVPLPERS